MILTGQTVNPGWSSVSAVVALGARLPEQVFRTNFTQYCWLDFEDVLDDPFVDCLRAISAKHATERFYVACVSPEPLANFGHSGIATFGATFSVSGYDELFDAGFVDPRITIRNVGDVIAYVADDGAWAFVADRTAEVAVGAQKRTTGWPILPGVRYLPFGTMLEIAAARFREGLPDSHRDFYTRNYMGRSWDPGEGEDREDRREDPDRG